MLRLLRCTRRSNSHERRRGNQVSLRRRRKERATKQLVPNRPTDIGREMGAQIARLTDTVIAKKLKPDSRCKTCAFRAGTLPNGCEETVMDAMKCVLERRTFMCHQTFDASGKPTEVCDGWRLASEAVNGLPTLVAPWSYSREPKA